MERDRKIDELVQQTRKQIDATRTMLDYLLRSKLATEREIENYLEFVTREKAELEKSLAFWPKR